MRFVIPLLCLMLLVSPARAQIVGAQGVGGGGQQGFGGQQGQQGVAGQQGQQGQQGLQGLQGAGGIWVDTQGVVKPIFVPVKSSALEKKRLEAEAAKYLPQDLNTKTEMRLISLVRLEEELARYAEKQESIPVELLYLAGLQRIDYVFVFPEERDLVIAGPAEGFAFDGTGRAIGTSSGRSPIRLDDLLVALRSVERTGSLGCSIDPQESKLADLKRYLETNSTPASVSVVQGRYQRMADILGMQNVRIWGVPAESHFSRVLVEADIRMKRMTMGLDMPKVKGFKSYLSTLGANGNSVQRWWFAPLYDEFVRNGEGTAYQFAGQRLQLLSQEELVDSQGQRSVSATTRVSTVKYAQHFTEKVPELVEQVPLFGELQNLFDVALLAALMKREELPQKASWKMSLLLDEKKLPTGKYDVPKQVESMATTKRAGKNVVGLIGGGVVIEPVTTAASIQFGRDSGDLRAALEKSQKTARSEKHPWWWDQVTELTAK